MGRRTRRARGDLDGEVRVLEAAVEVDEENGPLFVDAADRHLAVHRLSVRLGETGR